ncbi:MAG: hypothetical protein HC851_22260 [Acaryochloris sp. RU_4_1]|nr:hypothetical protein [Acaryochloris sp. RU_4_1]NJR56931.1 hypothetical protein [Acaryochloris sp. CRU_2_0]
MKSENKLLKISVRMATIMGIFLPLAGTVRRSNQILELTSFFSWFDDYILGAVLLIAAYRVNKKVNNAISLLIAAWGFVSGALFLSFLGQFEYYQTGDPGVFSTTFVATAKGLILAYMLVGLYLGIQSNPHRS